MFNIKCKAIIFVVFYWGNIKKIIKRISHILIKSHMEVRIMY
jgi:hypothetical protein